MAHFGQFHCFRFSGETQWVIVANGFTQTTAMTAAPGGEMVAVLNCAASDAVCLSPDSTHDFANFTVYYPPQQSTYPGVLMATFGGTILEISDAYCGLVLFDLTTGKWYSGVGPQLDELMSGETPPASLPARPSASGATALLAPVPQASDSCR